MKTTSNNIYPRTNGLSDWQLASIFNPNFGVSNMPRGIYFSSPTAKVSSSEKTQQLVGKHNA